MIRNSRNLILGTAQFGMPYGISNKYGATHEQEVASILEFAFSSGIEMIDTAPSYNLSEEVIGRNIREMPLKIITKTPVLNKNKIERLDVDRVIVTFKESLKKLNQNCLHALLIHSVSDLLVDNSNLLWQSLKYLKESGQVKKIGVSVYSPVDIEKILEKYDPDIVQVPVNVLDQRLLKNSYHKYLKREGVEIHARSIFLQGLLLMPPEDIPNYFDPIKPILLQYHEVAKKNALTPLYLALSFIYRQAEIDHIVFGVNNRYQLHEIIEVFNQISMLNPLDDIDYSAFALEDEAIINPSLWRI